MKKLVSALLAASLITICATASGTNNNKRLAPKQIMFTNNSSIVIEVDLPRAKTSYFAQPNTTQPIRDLVGGRFTQLELWDYGMHQKIYSAIVCDQAVMSVGGMRGSFTVSTDESLCG